MKFRVHSAQFCFYRQCSLAIKGMTAVRVASYNILCSTLAPPDRFCHCAPQDLEASARLPRILRQLDAEVDAGAVVCLQEVGREWCGRLHKYFADKGFHFVHSGYGERFNDYMGVGIAFPTSKFKLVDSHIARIADAKEWPRPGTSQPDNASGTALALAAKPLAAAWAVFRALLLTPAQVTLRSVLALLPQAVSGRLAGPPTKALKCPWAVSEAKANTCVFLRLQTRDGLSGGRRFCVGTYHMPCVFWDQRVMVIHSALVAQKTQQLAGSDPYILAGDFNFRPGSSPYKLLTQGHLSTRDEAYVEPPAPDEWRLDRNLEPMQVPLSPTCEPGTSGFLLPLSSAPFPR